LAIPQCWLHYWEAPRKREVGRNGVGLFPRKRVDCESEKQVCKKFKKDWLLFDENVQVQVQEESRVRGTIVLEGKDCWWTLVPGNLGEEEELFQDIRNMSLWALISR
jgi:hypothetical protein